ncbi:MAG: hypothetical protein ACOYN3_06935 [Acidimicrobiia bacterium]
MSVAVISDIFGYIAVSCGFTMTSIQAVRVQRRGPEGVSPLAWSLFLGSNTFFAIYGWANHYWPVAIGASLISPIMLFIVIKTGWRHVATMVPLACAVTILAAGVPVLIWDWQAGIPGAIAINIGLSIPAILALYKSSSAQGASATSWWINGTATFLLTISAALRKDWVFAGAQFLVCLSNLTIASLTVQRHHRLQRTAASTKSDAAAAS